MAEESAIYWVDIKSHRVHRLEPETGRKDAWEMPDQIGFLAPRADGGFAAGLKDGLAFLELPLDGGPNDSRQDARIEYFARPDSHGPENRFNDAKVDAKGRLWAGSMHDAESESTGKLYRVNADRKPHIADENYIITNGPAFSPQGKTLYHTHSPHRLIYAFDLNEDGGLSNKREFIRIPDQDGYPDGMTTDAEGRLWVCHWAGFRVSAFSPEGDLERVIELPVPNVTSCAFGGPNLDELYITTARKGLSHEELEQYPLAGALFRARPDVTGMAPGRFAG